jgi:hypothetical protein
MKKTLFGLSLVILIGIIFEFFFAGMGVFHAASFQIHQITGVILLAASLLLLIIAFIGKINRGFYALLFVLLFIQPLLLQIHQPFLQALHVVNALAIAAAATFLMKKINPFNEGLTRF